MYKRESARSGRRPVGAIGAMRLLEVLDRLTDGGVDVRSARRIAVVAARHRREDDAEDAMRGDVAGIDLQRAQRRHGGILEPALTLVEPCQFSRHFRRRRIQLRRALIRRNRLLEFAFTLEVASEHELVVRVRFRGRRGRRRGLRVRGARRQSSRAQADKGQNSTARHHGSIVS
jgi:hypothetical protein